MDLERAGVNVPPGSAGGISVSQCAVPRPCRPCIAGGGPKRLPRPINKRKASPANARLTEPWHTTSTGPCRHFPRIHECPHPSLEDDQGPEPVTVIPLLRLLFIDQLLNHLGPEVAA